MFDPTLAAEVALKEQERIAVADDLSLVQAFVGVPHFLHTYPERLSWRGCQPLDISTREGLGQLAKRYFSRYHNSDFPTLQGGTTPDAMVGIVMQAAYGLDAQEVKRIEFGHRQAMYAENCIGALLERYLDSGLREQGWCWCCGDFVRAIDFIQYQKEGRWLAVQVKNRDNSENSSSSAIRQVSKEIEIVKWFRSFSRTGSTSWGKLPHAMANAGLNEAGFKKFAQQYLEQERNRRGLAT